jgi:hypothetical protein
MKVYGGVDESIHTFLTSALDTCEWSASRPGTHWIGGLVDPIVGLDDLEKSLPGLELRPSDVQPVASRYTDYTTPALM